MNPFIWTTPEHFPRPVQISPITGREIRCNYAWQLNAACAERGALTPHGKAWRTRRAGR